MAAMVEFLKRATARRRVKEAYAEEFVTGPFPVRVERIGGGGRAYHDSRGFAFNISRDEMAEAQVQVRRGARLLDERCPGWEDVIQLDLLEIASCEVCVCGQLAYATKANTPSGRRVREALAEEYDSRSPYSAFREAVLGSPPGFHGFAGGVAVEVAWYELVTKRLAAKAA